MFQGLDEFWICGSLEQDETSPVTDWIKCKIGLLLLKHNPLALTSSPGLHPVLQSNKKKQASVTIRTANRSI